ncbi:MAG TPA: hypothetical protein VGL99_05610 [Chloroflexota bacterium]
MVARRLTDECLSLRVIATSREPLGVAGEVVWPVRALELPDASNTTEPTRLLQAAAAQLFVERAQSVRPEFLPSGHSAPIMADICRRLDELPTALREFQPAFIAPGMPYQFAGWRAPTPWRLRAFGTLAA